MLHLLNPFKSPSKNLLLEDTQALNPSLVRLQASSLEVEIMQSLIKGLVGIYFKIEVFKVLCLQCCKRRAIK